MEDAVTARERSAQRVLESYRERRRRRRGEDTYFGSETLFSDAVAEGRSVEELDSRRSAIIREAQEDGMPNELAALLYDVAWEEGLDPAVGYELVRTGLGVAPPEGGLSTDGCRCSPIGTRHSIPRRPFAVSRTSQTSATTVTDLAVVAL